MNTQLVKTLAQIIKTLSKEEQILLEAELHPQHDWETIKTRILERNQKIYQREGKSLETSINEIFAHQQLPNLHQTAFENALVGAQGLRPQKPIKGDRL